MLDAAFRSRLGGPLDRVARRLSDVGVSPNAVTTTGLLIGIGCCVAVAYERWWLGLILWICNRIADGLDGPIARLGSPAGGHGRELGGFFDIMADFAIYGGVLIAIAIALPETRLACLVTLLAYYLSGSSFLAFSSLATKLEVEGDGRSLVFPAGLAEGSETIAAYIVILAFPQHAEVMLWVWAAIVFITLLQRFFFISRLLR